MISQFKDKLSKYRPGIPPHFYVVFYFPSNLDDAQFRSTFQQLKELRLDGLTGISDNRAIIYSFFGVARDAFIVMDGQKTVDANDLRQITYEPDDLMANDMADLRRIFAGTSVSGAIHRLGDYILRYWKKTDESLYHSADYSGLFQSLSREKGIPPINTIRDLAEWLHTIVTKVLREEPRRLEMFENISIRQWEDSIYEGLSYVEKVYENEGEWETSLKFLSIPHGSRLYISWPSFMYEPEIIKFRDRYFNNELSEQELAQLNYFSHGKRAESIKLTKYRNYVTKELGSLYRIFFLPLSKFEDAKNRYMTKPR
jgi:hypothetical protein